MSDQNMTEGWRGSAGTFPVDPPPLTRRERREREEREAAALAAQTAPPPADSSPKHSLPAAENIPSDVTPATTPPSVQAAEPVPSVVEPPVAKTQPAPPMTRRERREWEERLRLEQEAALPTPEVSVPAPQATAVTVESGVNIVDDPPSPQESFIPVADPAAQEPVPSPTSPTALPPVFDAPPLPPRSGFPIVVEGDDADEVELASSRQVGSGAPATHALILPTTPTIDISGPIGDTGEIIVTGQIPLPRLVTERGVQGALDEDEIFDELIGAETTPLTSPVSAASAVSSKGNDREFHMVRKAPWGTAATVLGASAVLLVLAAAGLLAVALFTNLLTWPF